MTRVAVRVAVRVSEPFSCLFWSLIVPFPQMPWDRLRVSLGLGLELGSGWRGEGRGRGGSAITTLDNKACEGLVGYAQCILAKIIVPPPRPLSCRRCKPTKRLRRRLRLRLRLRVRLSRAQA